MAAGASVFFASNSLETGVSSLLRRFGLSKESTPSSNRQRIKQSRIKQSVNASAAHASSFSPATPPSRNSSAVRATSVTASSAVILEEPFQIVKDRAATSRAAAAEAMSLAKAAALAAKQAAALAETNDLSVLGNLDALSREWWDVTSASRSADAAPRSASATPSLSHSGDLRADPSSEWRGSLDAAQSPTDIFQQYIADKQRLSATFSAPSALPKAKKLSRKDSRKPPRQTPAPAPAAAPVPTARVLVASGKKGKRGLKERRSTNATGTAAAASNKEMNVQKMLVMGVPGSLRDLMDATPGPSGLLSAEEEIQLSSLVQGLLSLEEKAEVLREKLKREPSREEWAQAAGMTASELDRGLVRGRNAKQRMISCNMGLVIAIARKYSSWGLSLEEILTRGCSGLIKAIEKFDHRRGFKFSTYAHWWIRQSIGRSVTEQSRTVRMPPHIYELLSRIAKARDMLVRELGRSPADDEVAELVGMTAARLRKVLKSARPMLSMDKPSTLDDEQTLGSFVASPADESQEIDIERKLLSKDLQNALHTLLPREREVLKLRYGLVDGRARTLEEVGAAFRVTRERIRQLEHRALRKLRQPNRCQVLQEYVE